MGSQALTPEELSSARKWHVVAAAVSAMSFRGKSHIAWNEVFRIISRDEYKPPSKHEMERLLPEVHAELTSKVSDVLSSRGPWSLIHDGASLTRSGNPENTPDEKVAKAEALWKRQPTVERCKRAREILEPVKKFTLQVAGPHLSCAVPAWFAMADSLVNPCEARLLRSTDQRDHATKQERQDALQRKLHARGDQFIEAEHYAAFVLDPRMRSRVLHEDDGFLVPGHILRLADRENRPEFCLRHASC